MANGECFVRVISLSKKATKYYNLLAATNDVTIEQVAHKFTESTRYAVSRIHNAMS